jgi:hypothetical protein
MEIEKENLIKAFEKFRQATFELLTAIDECKTSHEYIVDDYPFQNSFDEEAHGIADWIDTSVEQLNK